MDGTVTDAIWHRVGERWHAGTSACADRIAVAVDGASSLEHGWVRGEDDDGSSLERSLRALRGASTPVTAITRITRSNHRSLERIGATVSEAESWVLVFPLVAGPRFDALAPRLAMALPWALRAASRWGERGFLLGAPLCLVGPHAPRVLRGEDRAYGPPCARCPARPACDGVARGYLERFDADELRPRPELPTGQSAEPLVPAAALSLGGTG